MPIWLMLLVVLWATDVWAVGNTFQAASCNNTSASPHVQNAVDLAGDGDRVMIPNGSCAWTQGITTTKQIVIRALNYTPTDQGIGPTFSAPVFAPAATRNVIITHNAGANQLINMTTGNSFHVEVAGIRFNEGTGTGNHVRFVGSGTKVAFFHDNYVEQGSRFGDSTVVSAVAWLALGGVGWNNWWQGQGVDGTQPGSGALRVTSPRAWTTPSTMGSLDVGGVVNVYWEDSTFYQPGTVPDADAGGRFVARHVQYDGATPITHGHTTGLNNTGRSLEFYDCVFRSTNVNRNMAARYIWLRAGTAVVTDCSFATVPGGQFNNGQPGPTNMVMGEPTPLPGPYPYPNQPGWGHNGTTDVIDPVYMWNLTGGQAYTGGAWSPEYASHVLSGREYFFNQGPKPNYNKFPYPHPLRLEADGGGGGGPTGSTYYAKVGAPCSNANSGTNPAAPWCAAPGMAATGPATVLVAGDVVFFDRDSTWDMTDPTGSARCGLKIKGGVTYTGDTWEYDGGVSGTKAKIRITRSASVTNSFFYGAVCFNNNTGGWGSYGASDHATIETVFNGFDVDGNNSFVTGISMNYPAWGGDCGVQHGLTGAMKRISNVIVHNVISDLSNPVGQFQFHYGVIVRGDCGTNGQIANVEIIDAIVHDTGRDAICLYPFEEDAVTKISNVTVRHSEAYNTGLDAAYCCGAGVLVKGFVQDAFIEYNYLHNVKGAGVLVNHNEGTPFASSATNVHLRYNLIVGDNVNGGIRLYDHVGGATDTKDVKIYGNILTNWTNGGLVFTNSSTGSHWSVLAYNNTFFNAPMTFSGLAAASVTALSVRNNISMNTDGNIPLTDTQGRITQHTNNLYFKASGTIVSANAVAYTSATIGTYEATALGTNPTFVSTVNLPTGFTGTYPALTPNTTALSLQPSSGGVNSGAVLGSPYNSSINSVTRVTYDRGAYDNDGTGGTDVTPPSIPANLRLAMLTYNLAVLAWDASTDDTAVTGYLIEHCSGASCSSFAQVGTPAGLGFNDTPLLVSTSYSWRVRATDAASNLSSYSSTLTSTTDSVKFHPTLNLRRVSHKDHEGVLR